MFKRLKGMKDLLWAMGIGLALAALAIGLIAASVISYRGDRTRPVMDLRREKQESAAEEELVSVSTDGLQPDGTLHPLAKTADAGEEYLDTLTILCDSSFISLRTAGMSKASVWGSESGSLPMTDPKAWLIRYPGDGSMISAASAALVAKPGILVIAVGSDGQAGLDETKFVENYEALIQGIAAVSPQTRIVCLSPCFVTAAYAGGDGLTKDRCVELSGWIRTACINTGAYYGDLSETLCADGYLREEYADGSGRALNNAGLREVLNYLRDHSVD